MGHFKEILPSVIYRPLLNLFENYISGYYNKSYSQEGEDMILQRVFNEKKEGFYVDVGALHPKRFSNTFHFYKKGWSGINIEPRPGSMKIFNKHRSRDINLEVPIFDESVELTYYMFNEPALNGFSKQLSEQRDGMFEYKLIGEQKLRTKKLEEIFDAYLPKGKEIDFLTIDVEGLDYNVLNSNNWLKFRPAVVLFEDITFNFKEIGNSKSCNLLDEAGYSLWAKTYNTVFYISDEKKSLIKK